MRSVEQVYIRMCIDMYIPMYMRRRACVRSGLMHCMYVYVLHMYIPA